MDRARARRSQPRGLRGDGPRRHRASRARARRDHLMATRRIVLSTLTGLVLSAWLAGGPAWGADYNGPLIDAHSHVPNATAIDAYVAATVSYTHLTLPTSD